MARGHIIYSLLKGDLPESVFKEFCLLRLHEYKLY